MCGGHFLACMDRSGQEKKPLLVFKVYFYSCGQRFSEISYFLLGERLARCKFFLEMNLPFINITNFAEIFPFVSGSPRNAWTNQTHLLNL